MVFFFYYIPTVGSILAIVAPAMLTLVQFDDLTPFLIVLLVFGTIQVVTANVIEPAIMGSTLNLSPLVVIVSLMVWGTIWGVVGMFLCVPITVVSLIVLAQFETTRPIACLLSSDSRIPGHGDENSPFSRSSPPRRRRPRVNPPHRRPKPPPRPSRPARKLCMPVPAAAILPPPFPRRATSRRSVCRASRKSSCRVSHRARASPSAIPTTSCADAAAKPP
jgi:hypothetical protein